MKLLTAIIVVGILAVTGSAAVIATAKPEKPSVVTYQGKTIKWWAKRAVKARTDANARKKTINRWVMRATEARTDANVRGVTILRLRKSVAHNPTIDECIKLATIAYPKFTERRAWEIIKYESWMTNDPVHAKNPRSTASGLYQFLTSTFASTPYGQAGMSIWSHCASSFAAGWMHQNGRGREWAYGTVSG